MKVIVELDQLGSITNAGVNNGMNLTVSDFEEFKGESVSDTTLQLVKQGVTVDEIIKLKNAELL